MVVAGVCFVFLQVGVPFKTIFRTVWWCFVGVLWSFAFTGYLVVLQCWDAVGLSLLVLFGLLYCFTGFVFCFARLVVWWSFVGLVFEFLLCDRFVIVF